MNPTLRRRYHWSDITYNCANSLIIELNRYAGMNSSKFEKDQVGHECGVKNKMGDMILNFAMQYGLMIANKCLKKGDEYLRSY